MPPEHTIPLQLTDRVAPCPACGSEEGQGVLRYPSKREQWAALSIFECTGCGFGYVPALHFDLASYYSEEYGEKSQRRHRLPPPAELFAGADQEKRPFITRARKHNEILGRHRERFERVLDFGPGVGAFLHYCSAAEKLAVELDQISFPYLDHLGVRRIDPDRIDELTGTLDLVIASHFVEHLLWNELDSYLRRVVALLKPGGLFLVEVPEWGLVHTRKLPKRQGHEPHTLFFSPRSLLSFLSRAGFTPLYAQTRSEIFRVEGGVVDFSSSEPNDDAMASQLCYLLERPPQG